MAQQQAFWLDESFDREHADDGTSRFDAEVRRRLDAFAEAWGDIAPVRFATAAWHVATALSPGYVRWHRRIVSVLCNRNAWDGGLTAIVMMASPWPGELTWTREWTRDRGWRDWPQTFGQFVEPSDQDVSRAPHLRAMLIVEAPLPLDQLPAAPEGPDAELERTARRAVAVIVRELNDLISPMITQLEAEKQR